ncbi:unnamed protein product, partial [Symbiodinium sp. CCMP2456]
FLLAQSVCDFGSCWSGCAGFLLTNRWDEVSLSCEFFAVPAMACDDESVWSELLVKLKIQDSVKEQMKKNGYESASSFFGSLKEACEKSFEDILKKAGVEPGCRRCPCSVLCPGSYGKTGKSFGLDLGVKLDADKLRHLWEAFEKAYPSEQLECDGRPAKQLIQQVYAQKHAKELRFIPWKQIVSEVQADAARLAQGTKEKSFLSLLAEASGQQDALELDPSPSPFVVQRILKMRGTCWALVDWCHLGSANKLLQKFVSMYAATNLSALGLRAPSLCEAEAADAELCRQLNLLLSAGYSLDKAIHETVCVRNTLHCLLQPRPLDTRKGKGKGRAHPYGRNTKGNSKGDSNKGDGKSSGKKKGEGPVGDACEPPVAAELGGLPEGQKDAWSECVAYHEVLLKDGGGLSSTLDWQIPPPAALKDPLGCVRRAILESMPSNSCARVCQLVGRTLDAPFFTEEEVVFMRTHVCACIGVDAAWASMSFPHTPYNFHLLEAMAARLHDVDLKLPSILKHGAPTGVRCAIPYSGVWPRKFGSDSCDMCCVDDLEFCEQNHLSAELDPARVEQLLQEEVAKGYVEKFTGSEADLRQRFKDGCLAVGKLVPVPNQRKAEVPSIGYFSHALDRFAEREKNKGVGNRLPCPADWILLSIDVKAAHKSIATAPEDIGIAVFQLLGAFYIYLVNHFGAAWSLERLLVG